MKENIISTVIGYIILAIIFLPLLVIKDAFWVGIVFVFFVVAVIALGQIIKPVVKKYIK